MFSHRLRALVAGVPIAVLSTVLIASPGFAAESLRISTPLAGTTVSGDLLIEGTIATDDSVELSLGLAPQQLGDCGSPIAERRLASAGDDFATTVATTSVPDGTYCLVAVADAGRLSTVVADITVNNSYSAGESTDGLQLPTESLGGDTEANPLPPALLDDSIVGDVSMLATIVLAVAAALAVGVLGLGFWARRRTAD